MRKWTPAAAGFAILVALVFLLRETPLGGSAFWFRLFSPGPLSAAHRSLEDDCAACHTPVKGVQPENCIVCHANNEYLLQRQPTAFHADVSSCKECHLEHQALGRRPTVMDHEALSEIGLRQLGSDPAPDSENNLIRRQLLSWLKPAQAAGSSALAPRITPLESILDCATCHLNDDRHFKLFGRDCAQCHATDTWTIPEFRHPSPRSMDCAQCHQAPPSHYMQHFKMLSVKVAAQPNARVDQCYLCHQTTSWPDIRRVGWYKHH